MIADDSSPMGNTPVTDAASLDAPETGNEFASNADLNITGGTTGQQSGSEAEEASMFDDEEVDDSDDDDEDDDDTSSKTSTGDEDADDDDDDDDDLDKDEIDTTDEIRPIDQPY